jgi:hypothetical protein
LQNKYLDIIVGSLTCSSLSLVLIGFPVISLRARCSLHLVTQMERDRASNLFPSSSHVNRARPRFILPLSSSTSQDSNIASSRKRKLVALHRNPMTTSGNHLLDTEMPDGNVVKRPRSTTPQQYQQLEAQDAYQASDARNVAGLVATTFLDATLSNVCVAALLHWYRVIGTQMNCCANACN